MLAIRWNHADKTKAIATENLDQLVAVLPQDHQSKRNENFVLSFSLSYFVVNENVVSDWIEIEKNQILQSHQSDHSNQGWQMWL